MHYCLGTFKVVLCLKKKHKQKNKKDVPGVYKKEFVLFHVSKQWLFCWILGKMMGNVCVCVRQREGKRTPCLSTQITHLSPSSAMTLTSTIHDEKASNTGQQCCTISVLYIFQKNCSSLHLNPSTHTFTHFVMVYYLVVQLSISDTELLTHFWITGNNRFNTLKTKWMNKKKVNLSSSSKKPNV